MLHLLRTTATKLPPTLRLSAAALAIFLLVILLHRLLRSIQRSRAFRAFAASHSAALAPPTLPHAWYLLGLDHLAALIKHASGHTLLAYVTSLFTAVNAKTVAEPVVMGGMLGAGGAIVTCDPANVRAVLATQFEDFSYAPGRDDGDPFIGGGIFTSNGARWAAMRGRLRPWFGRTAATAGGGGGGGHAVSGVAALDLYDLAGRTEGSLQTLLHRLRDSWEDGKTVDLAPLIFKMLMEVAAPMVLGNDFDAAPKDSDSVTRIDGAGTAYRNRRTWHRLGGWGYGIKADLPTGHDISYAEFEKAFDNCTERFSDGGDISIFGLAMPNEGFYRDCNLVYAFVEARVADAIARRTDKPNAVDAGAEGVRTQKRSMALVDHLAAAQPPLPLDAISPEAFSILFAARDTTAGTLCDLFWELARHPRVLARLRKETLEHFPADSTAPAEVTFDRVKQLPYLNAAIKETLRLHPVLPMNGKFAVHDTTLPCGGGPDGSQPLAVKGGTPVSWVSWSLHRIPEVYGEDVDVMRPERWLDGSGHGGWLEDEHHSEKASTKGIRPGWAYVPFNGGPRTCIGQQFALGTLSYVTVRMVQEMDKTGLRMESRDDRPWTEKFAITAKNLHGCLVAFVDDKAG